MAPRREDNRAAGQGFIDERAQSIGAGRCGSPGARFGGFLISRERATILCVC
ncbi:MAG TPA: hypothetical protein VIX59_06370 [Candidatus Binataceae bacterium]